MATVIRSGSIPKTSLPNQLPEPAEGGDHLVGDQQHVVAAKHRLDPLEVAVGRDDHAARALIGSAMNAATVSGPSREDQRLEVVGELLGERLVAHPRLRLPEPVRRRRVPDHRQRQVEVVVQARQAGQAGGHDADAVVAAAAAR